ncbi:hypothetical protein TetV_334 [Tetraselmis virus 1]|uniref:Uncharacterized protein n=1 Tax=Tetraselmis virus 1 TaxID=2060617 RepID=A0A2P0VND7_9VIRU|nr:hypothetical protein QJ968_gp334 [Tetraselmis virus 1]AUF82426.1 hypothetical protein TetV_334 [Tetraselmis virus 1]
MLPEPFKPLRPPWWIKYAVAVWLVPLVGDQSYTQINLAVLLAAYATKARGGVWAALLVNFVAINASFHLSLLEDPTVFDKFSDKYKIDKRIWHVLNFGAHVAPLALLLTERHRIRKTTSKERFLLAAGTSLVHLLWGVRVSKQNKRCFASDLTHIYIDLKDESWKRLWAVSLISHFAGSSLLP